MSCSRTQHGGGRSRTPDLSLRSPTLYHWATALPSPSSVEYALSQLFIENNLLIVLSRWQTIHWWKFKINTCTKLVGNPFIDNYSKLSCSWCCFTKRRWGGGDESFYYPVKPIKPSITLVKPGFSQQNPLGWAILIKPGFCQPCCYQKLPVLTTTHLNGWNILSDIL